MNSSDLPLTGYSIERIYAIELVLCEKEATEEPTENRGQLGFGWDWRSLDSDRFEVRISVAIEPTTARDEFARVSLVGRFRRLSGTPTVGLKDFVSLQAPAILFPYARQALANLTAQSIYGQLHIPPVNVARLMKGFDWEASRGAKQLKESDHETPSHSRSLPAARAKLVARAETTRRKVGGKRK